MDTENRSQSLDNAEPSFDKVYSPSPVDDIVDEDTCTQDELNELFKHKYKIHDEPSVTNNYSYVLSLAKDDSFTCIAAGLSDGSVRLFEINSVKGLYIKPPTNHLSICGLRFMDETPNLLLVGTTNGLVRLLDLRTRGEVMHFSYTHSDNSEPQDILSFDRNSNNRILAMGTEAGRENVFLLFYDLRTSKEAFRYMESFSDDLTSICFHPQNPYVLCTGSTDGLINVFDVQECDESTAIVTTINTESTVQKLHWHKNYYDKDIVSCITHTNSFKAYTFEGEMIANFDRLKITETVKRNNESNCNLVDCHSMEDKSLLLIAGINSNNGSVLRSCKCQRNKLLPCANFEGNTQIVRESIFDSKTNILITAGEGGFVTLWTPLNFENSSKSYIMKMKSKKLNKITPY